MALIYYVGLAFVAAGAYANTGRPGVAMIIFGAGLLVRSAASAFLDWLKE